MFAQYQEIFKKRGHYYHQAMTLCPQARAQEFDHVIRKADVKIEDVVSEIPSGGGYLRHYLDPLASLIHIESSEGFADLYRANGAAGVIGISETHSGGDRYPGQNNQPRRLTAYPGQNGFFFEAFRVLKKRGVRSLLRACSLKPLRPNFRTDSCMIIIQPDTRDSILMGRHHKTSKKKDSVS
jgi:hypothetical protein